MIIVILNLFQNPQVLSSTEISQVTDTVMIRRLTDSMTVLPSVIGIITEIYFETNINMNLIQKYYEETE